MLTDAITHCLAAKITGNFVKITLSDRVSEEQICALIQTACLKIKAGKTVLLNRGISVLLREANQKLSDQITETIAERIVLVPIPADYPDHTAVQIFMVPGNRTRSRNFPRKT